MSVFENWKTSAAGLAAILVAVADLVHPTSGSPGYQADIGVILSGLIGLFAKDHDRSN